MKIIVAFVLVALIFTPTTVFGWKSINKQSAEECLVNCDLGYGSIDSSKPFNFILLGMFSLVGLGIFMQLNRLGKFETFSIRCKTCRKKTNGLKCPTCEAEKQRVM